jgi:hypothetical protein
LSLSTVTSSRPLRRGTGAASSDPVRGCGSVEVPPQARRREISRRTLASSSFSSSRCFTRSPILTMPFGIGCCSLVLEDHHRGHRLALLERAQTRAEGVSKKRIPMPTMQTRRRFLTTPASCGTPPASSVRRARIGTRADPPFARAAGAAAPAAPHRPAGAPTARHSSAVRRARAPGRNRLDPR